MSVDNKPSSKTAKIIPFTRRVSHTRSLQSIKNELLNFETKHNMLSETMLDLVSSNKLEESIELIRWAFLFSVYKRIISN